MPLACISAGKHVSIISARGGNELTGRDAQGNPFITILHADLGIATRLAERGGEVSIAAMPN